MLPCSPNRVSLADRGYPRESARLVLVSRKPRRSTHGQNGSETGPRARGSHSNIWPPEQPVCSHDIRIEECVSSGDGSVDMAFRGQMENRRRPVALKNRIQGGTITDVRLLEG